MIRRVVLLLLFGMMALLWAEGHTWGDEQAVPQGIIVSPSERQLSIQIKTDYQVYSPNEALKLSLELSRDAYVYIYDINPAGRVTLLFPNGFSRNNFWKAGKHTLPDNSSYSLVVTEPLGLESLQALALLTPIPLLDLGPQRDLKEHPFPQLSGSAITFKPQVQKLIEITVEPGGWAADWTQFLVAPAVAYLKIVSEPAGAQVYLNGELRGASPLELTLEPGRVSIVLVKDGYQSWSRRITLENRARSEFSIRLEPARPPLFPPARPSAEEEIPHLPFSWGVNAGLTSGSRFSVGLELGFSSRLSLGGSISFTEDDVPTYYDIGHPEPFAQERVYNQGPETEAYLTLSFPLWSGLALDIGGGIAVQERVHIAAPGGVSVASSRGGVPLVEVLPNGYSETTSHLTVFAGASLRVGEHWLGLKYHVRRGWVLGLTLQF
jgi:hypothetical protein